MAERHGEYERPAGDWYVEPEWVVEELLQRVPLQLSGLTRALHDPCCGGGTIPRVAIRMGIYATGADSVDRAQGLYPTLNFFYDTRQHPAIVTNPPFARAEAIIARGLKVVAPGGIVAVIANSKFLHSQARWGLFSRPEMERVLVFSRRPSMPPGEILAQHGEGIRGGGSIDFVWCVWRVGRTAAPPTIEWIR